MADAEPPTCGDCGSPMILRSSRYGQFYGCTRFPDCRGAVGAHADGTPLGVAADGETRRARMLAHEKFDLLWKPDKRGRRHMSRSHAYRWMRTMLGLTESTAHIAKMDGRTCARLTVLVDAFLAVNPDRRKRV